MFITKKTSEPASSFVPAASFLGLDSHLMKQFGGRALALLDKQDRELPNAAASLVKHLILAGDPRELVHFAFLHNQRALYNTLREFIALNIERPDIPEGLRPECGDIAAQFLTQAYCIYHEPNNARHINNYWSYWLAIDLRRVFRPFEVRLDQTTASAPQKEAGVDCED